MLLCKCVIVFLDGADKFEGRQVGVDAGDGLDALGEGGEEGMVGVFAGFAHDFFDDGEVAVGECGCFREAGLVVLFGGIGGELGKGGCGGFADDGGAGGKVADALHPGGGDDGDDSGDAHEEGDVDEAERPAEEAVPEGEFAAVGAYHAEFEDGFAQAPAVEEELAEEVVEEEEQADEEDADS